MQSQSLETLSNEELSSLMTKVRDLQKQRQTISQKKGMEIAGQLFSEYKQLKKKFHLKTRIKFAIEVEIDEEVDWNQSKDEFSLKETNLKIAKFKSNLSKYKTHLPKFLKEDLQATFWNIVDTNYGGIFTSKLITNKNLELYQFLKKIKNLGMLHNLSPDEILACLDKYHKHKTTEKLTAITHDK